MRLGFAEQFDLAGIEVEVEHAFIHFERRTINHHGIAKVRNSTAAVDVVDLRKTQVPTGHDRDFHMAHSVDDCDSGALQACSEAMTTKYETL